MVRQVRARVVSVHAGASEGLTEDSLSSIRIELDGVVGDPHRAFERKAFKGDKQPEGTVRRNERQWSAVSVEELEAIAAEMNLAAPLSAGLLGANLCLEGVRDLSRLPKGTLLKFASGAELVVEEYNPPCRYMGEKIAAVYKTRSGEVPDTTAFSKAAKLTRGIVGCVDVAGIVNAGDEVVLEIYEVPGWLQRDPD